MALTPKQSLFVREYLVDLNATQAAIRAGYAPATANREGSRLLSNVDIRAAVEQGRREREARAGVTADEVVKGLKEEALWKGEGSSHSARVAAWGWLGKHLAMFVERQQVEGEATLHIVRKVVVSRGDAPGGSGSAPSANGVHRE